MAQKNDSRGLQVSALAAMAEGNDTAPIQPEAPGATQFQPLTVEKLSGGNIASRERNDYRSDEAPSLHFKKLMTPLLLVVGLVLMLVAVLAAAAASGWQFLDVQSERSRKQATLIALCAAPVAASLLGAAWLFGRDIRRIRRRD